MDIADLILPERVTAALSASGKPQLLRALSQAAGKALALDPQVVLRALQAREQLGSTGVGHGIAVPHYSVPGLGHFFGSFARMARPIDFEAIDGEPVDLVFLLLIPEDAGREAFDGACINFASSARSRNGSTPARRSRRPRTVPASYRPDRRRAKLA